MKDRVVVDRDRRSGWSGRQPRFARDGVATETAATTRSLVPLAFSRLTGEAPAWDAAKGEAARV